MDSSGNVIVEQLGKCYKLPSKSGGAMRGAFGAWWDRMRGRPPVAAPAQPREFWALREVSFEVEPGTILGVVGPNGAGKSTLLKILAKVTPPSEGRVIGSGRVVSLLELGAGFNPDIPVRENVIMNAALNGISKAEALARLPQILEFAELDRFSETPLKHYSSGMYLRLAFSVAINMEPKILLADEILAVGDMVFQERCLQKVEEAGRQGLSVLFVSHDMEAIMRICNRVVWINRGRIERIGDPEDVVGEYQDAAWSDVGASRSERGRQSSRFAAIRGMKLLAADGREIGAAPVDEDVYISIALEAFKTVSVKGAIDVHARKQLLFRAVDDAFRALPRAGQYEVRVRIPGGLLTDITYDVTASVTTLREGQERQYRLVAYHALSFMAFNPKAMTGSEKGRAPKTGLVAPRLDWTVETHQTIEV